MKPERVIEALQKPAAFPQRPRDVRVLETHISKLFFAGGFVYKVKKPIKLDFLDFSSLDQRRHYCEEEVRLNAELAAGVYLGVVPICETSDGHVIVEGPGRPVEYAVKMRELPEARMMTALLEQGDIDNQKLRRIAGVLAGFFEAAATGPGVDEHGSFESVQKNALDNFAETREFAGSGERHTVSPILHGFLEQQTQDYLDRNKDLFQHRVTEHRVREGHGDLHTGNICILGNGAGAQEPEIVIYDRIEFSRAFRCGDVAGDLAFLLMDLDRMGYAGFGGYLFHEYVRLTGDEESRQLLSFYKSYRAMVRAKVGSIRLAQLQSPDPKVRWSAARYYQLAASYFLPPSLVLMCGMPASGKSVAARRLRECLGARVLNSDVTRKRLAGIPPMSSGKAAFGEGIYGSEWTDKTYSALLEEVRQSLSKGRAVIVDAGFRAAAQRAPFLALAAAMGLPCLILEVTADPDIICARLEERGATRRSESDADLDVIDDIVAAFEPLDEVPASQRLRVDGSDDGFLLTSRTLDHLVDEVGRQKRET